MQALQTVLQLICMYFEYFEAKQCVDIGIATGGASNSDKLFMHLMAIDGNWLHDPGAIAMAAIHWAAAAVITFFRNTQRCQEKTSNSSCCNSNLAWHDEAPVPHHLWQRVMDGQGTARLATTCWLSMYLNVISFVIPLTSCCRSGRQVDPARTHYDAYLYALQLDTHDAASPLAYLSASVCNPMRCASEHHS